MLIHLSLSPSPSIASLSDMVIFCLASSQLIYPSICKTMNLKDLQMIFLVFLFASEFRPNVLLKHMTAREKPKSRLQRDTVWCSS